MKDGGILARRGRGRALQSTRLAGRATRPANLTQKVYRVISRTQLVVVLLALMSAPWPRADRSQDAERLPPARARGGGQHLTVEDGDGVWNRTPRSLETRVQPSPWGSWSFRAFAALVLSGLLMGGYLLHTARIRARNRALQAEIRERQSAEEERDGLIAELGEKNEMLEDQNAELERFAYTVSHDLRTPLVTIKGFLGLLERHIAAGNAEAVAHDTAVINNAADKMRELLDDLLTLNRVGRVVNRSETVPLAELAEKAVDLVAAPISAGGVEVSIDSSMPEVRGDRRRLLQAMQNLIGNAVKFMGAQPEPRIEVGAERRGDEALCYVRDNGIGIDPKYHRTVFGLFDRLDPSVEGTGVGLALVKRIIEIHGGKIWIESDGRQTGATFFFTLPCEAGKLS